MKCKCCNNDAIKYSRYSSGEFCSKICACSFSTKAKKQHINESVRITLTKEKIDKICINCNNVFKIAFRRRYQKCCSKKCSGEYKWKDIDYRNNITNQIIEKCKNIDERNRLKEIGRKGGFGTKGYTSEGTYYESLLEKECFEYIESIGLQIQPHKNIPNSSKVSDMYLIESDIWIEIDGIDRDKRKKWLGENYNYWLEKLNIYKKQNLNYLIVKNLNDLKNILVGISTG